MKVAHKKNIMLVTLGLVLGLTLFFFGCWQLDLIAAPHIDWSGVGTQTREILRVDILGHTIRWLMSDASAYVMFFTWIIIGAFIPVVTIFVALWYWED